jgi:hypothetical protein
MESKLAPYTCTHIPNFLGLFCYHVVWLVLAGYTHYLRIADYTLLRAIGCFFEFTMINHCLCYVHCLLIIKYYFLLKNADFNPETSKILPWIQTIHA